MADEHLTAADSGQQLATLLYYVEAFTDEFLCDLRNEKALPTWEFIGAELKKIPGVIKASGLDLLLQWNSLKKTVRDIPPHERNAVEARVQEIADKTVLNPLPTGPGTSSTSGQASIPLSGTSAPETSRPTPVASTSSASTDVVMLPSDTPSTAAKTFDPRYPLARMCVRYEYHCPIDEATPCRHSRSLGISNKPMGPINRTRENLRLTFEPYHPDDPGRCRHNFLHYHHNSKASEGATTSRNDTCSLVITSTPLCIVPLHRNPQSANPTLHQVGPDHQNTLATVCSATTSMEVDTQSNTIPYQVHPAVPTDHHNPLAAACSSTPSTVHAMESGATADFDDSSQLSAGSSYLGRITLPDEYYALLDSINAPREPENSPSDDGKNLDYFFDPKDLE